MAGRAWSLLLALSRPLLLGVLALACAFALLSSIPGVENGLVGRNADAATRAVARVQLGLDQPLPVRLRHYLEQAAQGDLGRSWLNGEPVARIIAERLPLTLALVLPGFLLGQWLAFEAAARPGRSRRFSTALALFSLAAGFPVLAALAQALLQALPGVPARGLPLAPPGAYLRHVAMPTAVLLLAGFGYSFLHFRAVLAAARAAPFALAAQARSEPGGAVGAARRAVVGLAWTRLLFGLPIALVGAMALETLFDIPGLGSRLVQSIALGDQPLVLAATLLLGAGFALLRGLLALLLALCDPRAAHA